ncbi:MAG: DNA repair protein RecO [Candidatus Dojkabacteria bacterium]|jgi:DNA repair protein RecO (recombination protein O)|nr:DNA repair protein RecO [Candidatus Dojkabacteria bacterium]
MRDVVTVIKSVNYSEADKVLTVFGKRLGKFALFARSIRKINSKNRGNMQTLCTSEISFYEGKGMPLLTESQLISSPNNDVLRNRVENLKRVLSMLNRILAEYDPNERVFDILQGVLKKDFDTESVNRFRVIFLKEMGFLQDFSKCDICNSEKDLKYIDISNFALLCKNCYINVGKCYELGENPYTEEFFTQALDTYVKKVIEEI